jgi:hypothetical protein
MSRNPIDIESNFVRIQHIIGPERSVENDVPVDSLKNRKVGEIVAETFSNPAFAVSLGLEGSDPLQYTLYEVKKKDKRAGEEVREV